MSLRYQYSNPEVAVVMEVHAKKDIQDSKDDDEDAGNYE